MTCHILANAIERNLNVIVSAPLGMGVVTSTLEELSKGSRSVINLNQNSLRWDLTAAINMQTEVIVFDSLERTDPELQDAAAELMRSRSLGGIKLPNLKSVVGFFSRTTDEMDDLADSYAALGPSLAMDWR
ncbi:hypothetical protein [Arthrobacter sp. ES1]|uniref:hypothetical protein n=1 Tax=Arthrobacter sp. ES1 TaxID=1897056 RepID=UPI001D000248|nr:hypothetical protein [Arthrobacter sp. ES1]MCB5281113.1 hypothetical protein [Arthrobacter sp. ES1]